jgi:hypothetical protein
LLILSSFCVPPLEAVYAVSWTPSFCPDNDGSALDFGRNIVETGLVGRSALVSGGSKGIGKCIARALALEGIVVCSPVNDNPMSAVADSERNFHFTNWKYWNVVGRFSWIVVLMTHTSGM